VKPGDLVMAGELDTDGTVSLVFFPDDLFESVSKISASRQTSNLSFTG
jgi:hypothetical protein